MWERVIACKRAQRGLTKRNLSFIPAADKWCLVANTRENLFPCNLKIDVMKESEGQNVSLRKWKKIRIILFVQESSARLLLYPYYHTHSRRDGRFEEPLYKDRQAGKWTGGRMAWRPSKVWPYVRTDGRTDRRTNELIDSRERGGLSVWRVPIFLLDL